MNVADFRRIFQPPQATDNNHAGFFDVPTFGQMVQFFRHNLGFTLPLRNPSNFKSKGLPQPKNKDGAGMKIPDWLLAVDMKLTNHYRMYNAVFRNVEMVQEHLEDEELDHLLEGNENVNVDKFMNYIFNNQEDPDTRIDPRSDKESLKADIDVDMVPVTSNEEGEESAGDEFKIKRSEKGKEYRRLGIHPHPHPLDHLGLILLLYLRIWRHSKNDRILLERKMNKDDVAAMIDEAIQKECQTLCPKVISQVNDVVANHIPSQYGNLGPKKYTLPLHKFPVVSFPNDDMEERTSRWVDKHLKKFNEYAEYSVEHWKNMWAKQDHIRRQNI
nr:hypothetical protein [Tanacetum cinerariifolium]